MEADNLQQFKSKLKLHLIIQLHRVMMDFNFDLILVTFFKEVFFKFFKCTLFSLLLK